MGVNDTIKNQEELQEIQSDLNNNNDTDTQAGEESRPSAFSKPGVNHFA